MELHPDHGDAEFPRQFHRDRLGFRFVARIDDDFGSSRRQALGDGLADPAVAAGDQRNLTFQSK